MGLVTSDRRLSLDLSLYGNLQRGLATSPQVDYNSIISRDTLDVLHMMELTLNKLSFTILNDLELQKSSLHWRWSLELFDTELTRLEESL